MFDIDTNTARLDRALVHRFLRDEAPWSRGIDAATVDRAIDASLCFGAYAQHEQIGFARVVTDRATFAYLADVFVVAPWRGRGVGLALVDAVVAQPDLQRVRRFLLATTSAAGLYAKRGFAPLDHPERFMQIHRPHVFAEALVATPEAS